MGVGPLSSHLAGSLRALVLSLASLSLARSLRLSLAESLSPALSAPQHVPSPHFHKSAHRSVAQRPPVCRALWPKRALWPNPSCWRRSIRECTSCPKLTSYAMPTGEAYQAPAYTSSASYLSGPSFEKRRRCSSSLFIRADARQHSQASLHEASTSAHRWIGAPATRRLMW